MFKGVCDGRLDNKGRINLPAKFREAAANIIGDDQKATLNITLSSTKPCLIGFIDRPDAVDSSKSYITEDNAPFCQEINVSNDGRFVLTPAFRAALTSMTAKPDHIIIVGRKEYFEIWTEENWKREILELFKKRGFNFEQNAPDAGFE